MSKTQRTSLEYRVWRWHFFAGLMVVPFAIILAISGAIYLFNPQYQNMLENRINDRASPLTSEAATLPADDIMSVALATHPGSQLRRFTLPRSNQDRSYEIELTLSEGNRVLWVDPYTADILHDIEKSDRLMEIVKDVHEGLLMDNNGSYVVELMASWMIILIITGTFLWWPRRKPFLSIFKLSLAGLSRRQKLRQLHGVIGAWVGGMVILLLLSGLPWTQVWGGGFERVTQWAGWDGPKQEWTITLESSDPHAEHRGDDLSLWERSSEDDSQLSLEYHRPMNQDGAISTTKIISIAQELNLGQPLEIQPPRGENGVWTVKSMMQDRPKRQTVHFDRWTGEEVLRIGFKDRHAVQQVVGYGIALHEGALFGWLNQLLGLIAALGVVALSITGTWMWWRRRPTGQLGVPPMPTDKRLRAGIVFLIGALALFLPMVLISLTLILVFDFLWTVLFMKNLKTT